MNPKLLLVIEIFLILAGFTLYALGYLAFPILPLILVAWASLRLRNLRWRDVGLKRPAHWLSTIAIAFLVALGYQALDVILITPLLQKLTGEPVDLSQFNVIHGNLLLLLASLALSWTLAAFIEEMFFRGYLINRIMDIAGKGRLATAIAIFITTLIFGGAHAYQGVTGMVDTAIAGLLLGSLYFFARKNLWLPILTHGFIDTIGFLLIYLGLYN